MLLEGRNIGYRYGKGPWVLRGANICINSGEVVGLMGPSGIGKSTLARMLSGYLRPIEGKFVYNGDNLPFRGYCPVQLIFQHPEKAVNPRWRMWKVLNEGWKPDDETLKLFGIEKYWLNRWPNELSGGELQRFCVVRALAPEARFIIADEMSTMLDAITQAQIWEIVLEIAKKRNIGLLVVSHNSSLLDKICTRILDIERINQV